MKNESGKKITNYKKEYYGLWERFKKEKEEDKLAYERKLKSIDDSIRKKKESLDKFIQEFPLLYTQISFSEGFLAPNIRFELKVSAPIGPQEIERLIEKLKMDKLILEQPHQQEK